VVDHRQVVETVLELLDETFEADGQEQLLSLLAAIAAWKM
jgi:hypothetical protein